MTKESGSGKKFPDIAKKLDEGWRLDVVHKTRLSRLSLRSRYGVHYLESVGTEATIEGNINSLK